MPPKFGILVFGGCGSPLVEADANVSGWRANSEVGPVVDGNSYDGSAYHPA
jgi:hypothetical protein